MRISRIFVNKRKGDVIYFMRDIEVSRLEYQVRRRRTLYRLRIQECDINFTMNFILRLLSNGKIYVLIIFPWTVGIIDYEQYLERSIDEVRIEMLRNNACPLLCID